MSNIKLELLVRETQGIIRQLGNLLKDALSDKEEKRCLKRNIERQKAIEQLLMRMTTKEYNEIMNREKRKEAGPVQTLF